MSEEKKQKRVWLRLGLVVLLIGGIYVVGKTTGYLDNIDVTTIQKAVQAAGAWGFVAYVALFAVGVLCQVPGMLFVATGMLVYGKLLGYAACLTGAIVAVCASFIMVRAVGGTAFDAIERPFVKKILARLEDKPIRTLIVLRLIVFIAPPVNYALALSTIKFRDYAIGSALGLITPMAFVAVMFDILFATEWFKQYLM